MEPHGNFLWAQIYFFSIGIHSDAKECHIGDLNWVSDSAEGFETGLVSKFLRTRNRDSAIEFSSPSETSLLFQSSDFIYLVLCSPWTTPQLIYVFAMCIAYSVNDTGKIST